MKISFLALFVVGACTSPTGDTTAPPPSSAPDDDVIVMMGHGRYLGPGWKLLEPSPELFERTQRALLERLSVAARERGLDVDATRARIASTQPDEFLADAALIEWLIEQAPPGDHATIRGVNGAMRDAYLGPAATNLARATFNSGQKYIDECREAGVPIPPPMYRTGPGNWERRGILAPTNILGGVAELWEYRDDNGLCIALPRYDADTPTATAQPFGVICHGIAPDGRSSKACFWDSPNERVPRGVERPLTSLVGGFDLEANNIGVCSDCHAGANPFVIHPANAVMSGYAYRDLSPNGWYEPIVHPNWPQNRGPSNLLAGVDSPRRCDDAGCHAPLPAGLAGQFPILSTELPGYCGLLQSAAGLRPGTTPLTMPPGLMNLPDYAAHRATLLAACGSVPDTGKIVGAPGPAANPSFLSRPSLQTVAYACATEVEVNNVSLHAVVTLTVTSPGGAVATYTKPADNVAHIEFELSTPLVIDDLITATQAIDGLTSPAATLRVRDHHLDYPLGIPVPQINPDLVHACADIIAVSHVPGAEVMVSSSLGGPVVGRTSSGWSSFIPGARTFVVGDMFSAQARMCPGDPWTLPSATVSAVAAPSVFPTPTFDPARAFDGQELVSVANLVNGAHTRFEVSGTSAGELDAPISWWWNFNLGRVLRQSDTVSAQMRLCAKATPVDIPVSKCEELPAPRIETPLLPGATAVVVALAQPGARIRVYDGGGTQIGNGSGTVIGLSRSLVAGDRLLVVQELGACRSSRAHQVYVRTPNGQ